MHDLYVGVAPIASERQFEQQIAATRRNPNATTLLTVATLKNEAGGYSEQIIPASQQGRLPYDAQPVEQPGLGICSVMNGIEQLTPVKSRKVIPRGDVPWSVFVMGDEVGLSRVSCQLVQQGGRFIIGHADNLE